MEGANRNPIDASVVHFIFEAPCVIIALQQYSKLDQRPLSRSPVGFEADFTQLFSRKRGQSKRALPFPTFVAFEFVCPDREEELRKAPGEWACGETMDRPALARTA